jgi:hypothetical protein
LVLHPGWREAEKVCELAAGQQALAQNGIPTPSTTSTPQTGQGGSVAGSLLAQPTQSRNGSGSGRFGSGSRVSCSFSALMGLKALRPVVGLGRVELGLEAPALLYHVFIRNIRNIAVFMRV